MSPLRGTVAEVPDALLERLAGECAVERAPDAVAAASRDWWPLAMVWDDDGTAITRAAAVVTPLNHAQVAAVARLCDEARVPLTVAAGRSGVCGAGLPRPRGGGVGPPPGPRPRRGARTAPPLA